MSAAPPTQFALTMKSSSRMLSGSSKSKSSSRAATMSGSMSSLGPERRNTDRDQRADKSSSTPAAEATQPVQMAGRRHCWTMGNLSPRVSCVTGSQLAHGDQTSRSVRFYTKRNQRDEREKSYCLGDTLDLFVKFWFVTCEWIWVHNQHQNLTPAEHAACQWTGEEMLFSLPATLWLMPTARWVFMLQPSAALRGGSCESKPVNQIPPVSFSFCDLHWSCFFVSYHFYDSHSWVETSRWDEICT